MCRGGRRDRRCSHRADHRRGAAYGDGCCTSEIQPSNGDGRAAGYRAAGWADRGHDRDSTVGVEAVTGTGGAARRRHYDIHLPSGMCRSCCGERRQAGIDNHIRRRLAADGDGCRIDDEIRAGDGDGLTADQWTIVRTDQSYRRGGAIGVLVGTTSAQTASGRDLDRHRPSAVPRGGRSDGLGVHHREGERCSAAKGDKARTQETGAVNGNNLAAPGRAAGRVDQGHRRGVLVGVPVDQLARAATAWLYDLDALWPGRRVRRRRCDDIPAAEAHTRRRHAANVDERRGGRIEVGACDGDALAARSRADRRANRRNFRRRQVSVGSRRGGADRCRHHY